MELVSAIVHLTSNRHCGTLQEAWRTEDEERKLAAKLEAEALEKVCVARGIVTACMCVCCTWSLSTL